MKRNEIKELPAKSNDELAILIKDAREKSRALRFDLAAGKVKNIGALRTVRKDIARLLTVMNAQKATPEKSA
jgi:ribosomal protein L29